MTRHDLSHLFIHGDEGEDGDPLAAFADRRRSAPLDPAILPSGAEVRVAVRYADVREAYGSPDLLRSSAPPVSAGADVGEDPDMLINMDGERHNRVRRIVAGAFTPRRVALWRPAIAAIAETLAEDLQRDPETPKDLIAAYALPLPIQVICMLLGVPADDLERFRHWSDAFLSTSSYTAAERGAAAQAFAGYLSELINKRRAQPGDALLDLLMSAHDGGDSLNESELVRLCRTLIVAGHETTANVLARGVLRLLATGQYGLLAADPALVPQAVEEILRFETPSDGGLPRRAERDVELPSGTIPQGGAVVAVIASANRDAAVFEDPERFDIGRAECPHLSFGYGQHYCLGANLARLELQVGLETLVRRLPGLHLAVPASEVPWKKGLLVRGPEVLPVKG